MRDENCLFCKIIGGEIPDHRVYEDDDIVGFLDIHPINPGHTLLMPKAHVDEFQDLDEQTHAKLFEAVQKWAKHLKVTLKPLRVGLIVEGLEVPHVHVHVVPINHVNDIGSKRTLEYIQSEPDHAALTALTEKLAKNPGKP